MTTNPLVAAAADSGPSPWAGVWICEDIELIAQGVRTGSWIDGSLGVVSAGLDALALVSDPAGQAIVESHPRRLGPAPGTPDAAR